MRQKDGFPGIDLTQLVLRRIEKQSFSQPGLTKRLALTHNATDLYSPVTGDFRDVMNLIPIKGTKINRVTGVGRQPQQVFGAHPRQVDLRLRRKSELKELCSEGIAIPA
jgi:hypothetical protein